jgi:hypothetical protein
VPRRLVVAVLDQPRWQPPGVDPDAWRHALAEDIADLLINMEQAEPALAVTPAGRPLADAVRWPTMPVYELPDLSVPAVLAAAAADGYDQAAVLAGDAPDVPGLVLAKLLRPLTTRPVAVAPAASGAGLLGLAARLPATDWLPAAGLDELSVEQVFAAAPQSRLVARTPGWHRLTDAAQLARLDPALDGWDATRTLLTAGSR